MLRRRRRRQRHPVLIVKCSRYQAFSLLSVLAVKCSKPEKYAISLSPVNSLVGSKRPIEFRLKNGYYPLGSTGLSFNWPGD